MGAWIEILVSVDGRIQTRSRTPRWVRGLKLNNLSLFSLLQIVAPHDGCVDWNCFKIKKLVINNLSHPTMGAWIEIYLQIEKEEYENVAPHDGCVDWNRINVICIDSCDNVAPHDGCVDWNQLALSSQAFPLQSRTPRWVRGLKFSHWHLIRQFFIVAPHDGCVDWNLCLHLQNQKEIRRTPRWVRGLKFVLPILLKSYLRRTPRWVRGLKSPSSSFWGSKTCRTPRWVRGLK